MLRILVPYLSSYGVSLLSNSITAIALPLLVLLTTGRALDAGIVAVSAVVPAAIAGILMGSLIDKMNRRLASILTDVIAAGALALLPIIELTVGLELGWFIAVAVLSSFGDVPGITARESMLPSIAKAAGMEASRLIGTREAISAVSMLVGPAVAGFLVAQLEPVTVMWFTSGLALLAALLTVAIPARATVSSGDDSEAVEGADGAAASGRSVFHGLKVIFRSPLLRSLILLMLVLGGVLAATQGMVIPVHFAFQDQAQYVGFVLSAMAAGLLIGGVLYAVFSARVSRLVWFGFGAGLVAAGFVVIADLGPVWLVFIGAALVGLGGGCMNSVIGVIFIENIHDGERGRVLGAQNALLTLIPGLGIGAASLLIEYGSVQNAAAVLAGAWILAAMASVVSRTIRRIGRG